MAKRKKKQTEAEKAVIEARDARIREETLAFFDRLKAIAPPQGHRWDLSRCWDTWFCGDLDASCRSGISFMLRSTVAEWNDPDQLHGEIRVFRGELRDSVIAPESAIVWFERGSRLAGSPRTDHVHAESSYVECEPPMTSRLVKDPADGLMSVVMEPIAAPDPAPLTGRHVYAGSWDAMTRHLLASVEAMLASDAACVAGGGSVPEGHDHDRIAA
jgi:hypothetical protein